MTTFRESKHLLRVSKHRQSDNALSFETIMTVANHPNWFETRSNHNATDAGYPIGVFCDGASVASFGRVYGSQSTATAGLFAAGGKNAGMATGLAK
jgi:hypothetical protein